MKYDDHDFLSLANEETQEEDTSVLWDCVSMFNIEDEDITEEEDIPETNVTTRSQNSLKEDNMILPKIKKLQENMKIIKNNSQKVNIPEFVITSQNPKKINVPIKSTENRVENVKKNSIKHEMGYDIVEDIKKAEANISLFEMCKSTPTKRKAVEST